jgi:5-methylcytosine-specific restriction endonuclease McrA
LVLIAQTRGVATQVANCPAHRPKPWHGSTRRLRLPSNWAALRTTVLDRDALCRVCLREVATEVDHIDPGDDHSLSNLRGICHGCHATKSGREGWEASRC